MNNVLRMHQSSRRTLTQGINKAGNHRVCCLLIDLASRTWTAPGAIGYHGTTAKLDHSGPPAAKMRNHA